MRPSVGDAARKRFVREARAVAAIAHENVVSIFHMGEEGPLGFITMPCLSGETLQQRIECESRLEPCDTADIGWQIASGLEAAHATGVVHRDINPANIWLESDTNRVKILDFGLAQWTSDSLSLTETGLIAGTPAFMSPEQARGEHVDARSDLFSLGSPLYQCLTGTAPFRATNHLATLAAIQKTNPPTPRDCNAAVPKRLSRTVMRLLQKDRRHRPRSAALVAEMLQAPERQPSVAFSLARVSRIGVVCTLLLGLLGYVAPSIFSIALGNNGELVIKTDDPHVKVEVLQGGKRVRVVDLKKEQSVTIRPGDYQLEVSGTADLELRPNAVTIKRNGREIVHVERILGGDSSAPPATDISKATTSPAALRKRGDVRLLPLTEIEVAAASGTLRLQANAVPVERTRAFAVITGLVPLRKQFREYVRAYLNCRGYLPERDFPRYLPRFQVERAEVSETSSDKWKLIWGELNESKWSPEEQELRLLNDIVAHAEEVVSLTHIEHSTMLRLPLLSDGDSRKFATHSKIPLHKSVRPNRIICRVSPEGTVRLDDDTAETTIPDANNLIVKANEIKRQGGQLSEVVCFIQADASLKAEKVQQLIQIFQEAGFERFELIAGGSGLGQFPFRTATRKKLPWQQATEADTGNTR